MYAAEQPYDQLPTDNSSSEQGTWVIFLIAWGFSCIVGVALIVLAKQIILGVVVLAPLTLVAAIWKPSFGLCLVMAVIPMGRAVGIGSSFSLEKAAAVLLLIGVLGSVLSGRARLKLWNPICLLTMAFATMCMLSLMWATNRKLASTYVWTAFQFYILVVLVVTLCTDRNSVLWPLRVLVLACLVLIPIAHLLGMTMSEGEYDRLTLGVGENEGTTVDPSALANIIGCAFFAAIYLNRTDPIRRLRWLYVVPIAVLPILMLLTGSRGQTIALVVAVFFPLLLLRQVMRRPWILAIGVLALAGIAALFWIGMARSGQASVFSRLTDVNYAKRSVDVRYGFIDQSITYVMSHPLGAGICCWFDSTGHRPHNDFFFLFSSLGYAGAALYIVLIGLIVRIVKRASGWDKYFVRAIPVFMLVGGLSVTGVFYKHFWILLTLASVIADDAARSAQEDLEAYYPAPQGGNA